MRFVVCGEALIDLMPEVQLSPQESRWIARSGGGPMNSAVALAKQGLDTHFLGRLSSDAFGRQLRSHLEEAGVALDLAVDTEDPTTMAVVSLDDQGKASYAFHFDGTTNFNWKAEEFPVLRAEDWLHFGSIGAVIDPGHARVLEFVGATDAAVSFDINVRPSTLPERAESFGLVSDLMAAVGTGAGIVKASDEDIAWLVDDEENPLGYAQAWAEEYGLAMFIVTLGPDGVAAVRPDGRVVQVPGHKVEVVDTVGAGDTYMAALLTWLAERDLLRPAQLAALDQAALTQALQFAARAAAITCSRRGADLPRRAELG